MALDVHHRRVNYEQGLTQFRELFNNYEGITLDGLREEGANILVLMDAIMKYLDYEFVDWNHFNSHHLAFRRRIKEIIEEHITEQNILALEASEEASEGSGQVLEELNVSHGELLAGIPPFPDCGNEMQNATLEG